MSLVNFDPANKNAHVSCCGDAWTIIGVHIVVKLALIELSDGQIQSPTKWSYAHLLLNKYKKIRNEAKLICTIGLNGP